ncbi:RPII140-upstream gene protein [Toxorhynchites rutilus septentrionalis]|uniref:RPII140-upstream gene protein n=1 Tax=Toxorhynchites rutilus septentrionalis TaxID=329112 RepID=UPI00247A9146|nr:RPII140-upstream gene protein [Toxorhynchites rutilus septentrionalis]
MLRKIIKSAVPRAAFVTAGIFPFSMNNHDTVEHDSLQKMYSDAPGDQQSGKERLYLMFSFDEFGRMSSELNAIYQAGFLGFFVGACYGGFVDSRVSYMNFMERNQATAFQSSFEAKRKLQDQVSVNFAKGAFKWGWRIALFTTSYVGIQTVISVYRGKSSIYEYLAAGGLTGAAYKFNMGLKGMTSGGLVGLTFGGIAGAISLALLRASGTTMEEVRFWQYKWRANRDQLITENIKQQTLVEPEPLLMKHHEKVGESNVSLDKIETAGKPLSNTDNETVNK